MLNRLRPPSAPRAPRPSAARGAVLVVLASLAGCGVSSRAAPLDEGLARVALEKALESWKKGDPPDALEDGTPAIIAQDPDWSAGARLTAYEPDGEGRRVAENLFVPVRLSLRAKNGRKTSKSVVYIIGTSPRVMVVRARG